MAQKEFRIKNLELRIGMKYFLCFLLVFFLLLSHNAVLAESNYVLPYPSFMPGSFSYRLHLLMEFIEKYWYFGNFGQFKYNLKESDKYLVEAKTLFEYRQYLLGYQALKKSDSYFEDIPPFLIGAKEENKDISKNKLILKEAAIKHLEVLNQIREGVPAKFVWSPEKSSSTPLNLEEAIKQSVMVREKYL